MAGALACTPNPGPPADAPAPGTTSEAPAVAPVIETPAVAPVIEAPAKPEPEREPVEVVVRDLAGAVVVGATVLDAGDGTEEQRTHVTDARGVAVVPGGTSVTVTAPGFVPLAHGKAPRHGRADLYLLPESTIAGRVVDERGSPVAGATVQLHGGWSPRVELTTDAEGRFRADELAPGRRVLSVRGGVIGDRMVALGFAERAAIEVKARRTVTLAGRAVLAETGAPCTGGWVTLYVGLEGASSGCPICGGEDPTVDAQIEDDGTVRFEVARGLTYGVEVACFGTMKAEQVPVIVGEADVSGLRWEVPRGLQIRGMVVDDKGKPVPGIELALRSDDGGLLPDATGERSARTDEEGRFSLAGLVEGGYEIEAFSETPVDVYYKGEAEVTLEERDLEDVVIRVRGEPWQKDEDDAQEDEGGDPVATASALIRGVVLDARGKPVAGAIVVAAEEFEPEHVLWLLRRWDGGTPVVSGAEGSFAAPAPATNDDEGDEERAVPVVVAFAPGGAVGLAGAGAQPVEVRVRPPAAITVKVRDRRGRPFSHFGVDLARRRSDPEYVHAPGGTFTIPGFLPGSYQVRIHTPEGDLGKWIEVPASGSPAVATYALRDEVESLTINVDDAVTRENLAGCKVAIGPIGGRRMAVASDGRGMAEFEHVPAGPAQVDVLPCSSGGKRYPAQSVRVFLRPDATSFVSVSIAGHDGALVGRAGELGYALEPRRAGIDPLLQPLRVQSVARGGPAERAGLKVGDVIVKIGEVDVAGRRAHLIEGLTRVAAGTRVTLGLADGRKVELSAE